MITTCPDCKGEGRFTYKRGYRNYFGEVVPDLIVTCATCKGDGLVNERYLKALQEEQRLFRQWEKAMEGGDFAANE